MIKRTETNRVVFHHSFTDSGTVDSFRKYHMSVNGWEDIGYHFVVPIIGHYQEGRDIRLMGAHAKGKNSDSIGVCLIGNFFDYEPPMGQLCECLKLYHNLCRLFSKNLTIEFHRAKWLPNACPGPKLNRKDFIEVVARGQI